MSIQNNFINTFCSEIYLNDAPFNQCPRSVLRKQVEKAKKLGYLMMAGFERKIDLFHAVSHLSHLYLYHIPKFGLRLLSEAEFLLLDKDGKDFTYSRAIRQSIHLHDGRSIMRDSKLLCRIHGVMETLGWKPYQVRYFWMWYIKCRMSVTILSSCHG